MGIRNSVKAQELIAYEVADLKSTWTPIISGGLAQACFYIRFMNESDTDLFISYDGEHVADRISSGQTVPIYFQNNVSNEVNPGALMEGTPIYARTDKKGSGMLYISGYYYLRGR